MLVVAFDLSLRSTGIARLSSFTGMSLRTCKTDRAKLDLQDAVRVQSRNAADSLKIRPNVILMEGSALAARGRGHEELAALRWMIKDFARHQLQREVVEISPSHLKKTVTGDGRATKQQVVQAVNLRCQLREWPLPANDDEADAIALILTWEADLESNTPSCA